MDWRTWLHEAIQGHPPLISEIPIERWFSAAAFTEKPSEKPFAVVTFGLETERITVVRAQTATIWIYDIPGSFFRIDEILDLLREAIRNHLISGLGIAAIAGDAGADTFDQDMQLITRNLAIEFFARKEE